ncbi:hypothetical protein COLO4_31621 [Corchorus olitorius]|uniref:F-box domain-containing protein n=1 Tax=Corchorus olitorius TaxID=93759 RepID=A0A1R3H3V4_9ROSI|nr:hypothetical protein COLO4_31621 [Corchorus olitorius]
MANKTDKSLAGKKKVDLNRFMIEELPDEILSVIISFLSVKEAIRTSTLSKRWRYLYLFMSRLNFDVDTFVAFSDWRRDVSSTEEHFKSVYKLLQHYSDSKIESFRLSFPDSGKSWEFWATNIKLKHLSLQNCYIGPPAKQPVLHSLATLQLEDYRVHETIFSTCVNLRKLVLRNCVFDPNLTIAGPTLSNLKCLQFFTPRGLEKLQVSAANLTYVEYRNPDKQHFFSKRTQFSFSNVPKLEGMLLDLRFGNRRVDDMFTDFAPQLRRLISLHTTLDFNLEPQILVTSIILRGLEQLELILDMKSYNLLKMIPILVACPLLQKFHLTTSGGPPTNVPDMRYPRESHPFPNLKEVQIKTFYFTSTEISFVFYMLENAVALERMILDPPKSCDACEIKLSSRELPDKRIRAKVASPTAKLVLQHHSDERIDFANPYRQFWSYIDFELSEDDLLGVYDGSYRWIRSATQMGVEEELNLTYLDDADEIGAAYMDSSEA